MAPVSQGEADVMAQEALPGPAVMGILKKSPVGLVAGVLFGILWIYADLVV